MITQKFIKFLSHLLFFKKFKENSGPITCIAINDPNNYDQLSIIKVQIRHDHLTIIKKKTNNMK